MSSLASLSLRSWFSPLLLLVTAGTAAWWTSLHGLGAEAVMLAFALGALTHVLFSQIRRTASSAKLGKAMFTPNRFFASMVENMATGVAVVDLHGNFIFFNPRATEIAGVGATDLPASEWAKFWGLHDLNGKLLSAEELPLVRALKGEKVDAQQMMVRNPHLPEPVIASVSASPIRDENQRIIGGVALIEDVTASHQLKWERAERRNLLEEQVAHVTSELQARNEELVRFSHAVSHDLKEPVRMMGSFAQLLERQARERLSEEEKRWLQEISGQAKELTVFIDDLLSFAKLSGERKEDSRPVDLNESIVAAKKHLKLALSRDDIQLHCKLLPKILAESVPFVQLFQNLLSNSIKYRRPVPLEIEIGNEKREKDWLFWVKDNGVGISPEHLTKVFLPFYRCPTDRGEQGSGIGLTICQRVVQRFGGKIWAESDVDAGTKVCFTLPSERILLAANELAV